MSDEHTVVAPARRHGGSFDVVVETVVAFLRPLLKARAKLDGQAVERALQPNQHLPATQ